MFTLILKVFRFPRMKIFSAFLHPHQSKRKKKVITHTIVKEENWSYKSVRNFVSLAEWTKQQTDLGNQKLFRFIMCPQLISSISLLVLVFRQVRMGLAKSDRTHNGFEYYTIVAENAAWRNYRWQEQHLRAAWDENHHKKYNYTQPY